MNTIELSEKSTIKNIDIQNKIDVAYIRDKFLFCFGLLNVLYAVRINLENMNIETVFLFDIEGYFDKKYKIYDTTDKIYIAFSDGKYACLLKSFENFYNVDSIEGEEIIFSEKITKLPYMRDTPFLTLEITSSYRIPAGVVDLTKDRKHKYIKSIQKQITTIINKIDSDKKIYITDSENLTQIVEFYFGFVLRLFDRIYVYDLNGNFIFELSIDIIEDLSCVVYNPVDKKLVILCVNQAGSQIRVISDNNILNIYNDIAYFLNEEEIKYQEDMWTKYDDLVKRRFPLCENKTTVNGNILYPDHMFFLPDRDKLYCFTDRDIYNLYETRINPFTNKEISQDEYNKLKTYEKHFDDVNKKNDYISYLYCLENDFNYDSFLKKGLCEEINKIYKSIEVEIPLIAQDSIYILYNYLSNRDVDDIEFYISICLCIADGFYYGTREVKYKKYNVIPDKKSLDAICDVSNSIKFKFLYATPWRFLKFYMPNFKHDKLNKMVVDFMTHPKLSKYKASTILFSSLLVLENKSIEIDKNIIECSKIAITIFESNIKEIRDYTVIYKDNSSHTYGDQYYIPKAYGICYKNKLKPGNQDYPRLQILNKGGFGEVFISSYEDKSVVVKTNLKSYVSNSNEVAFLKELEHPNIIKILDAKLYLQKDKIISDIILERAKTDLFEYTKNRNLDILEIKKIAKNLLSALSYCHDRNIVHLDLKDVNVLLDKNLSAKLADFGFGIFYCDEHYLPSQCLNIDWRPLEVTFNPSQYDPLAVDVWSMGVIIVKMAYFDMFHVLTISQLIEQISEAVGFHDVKYIENIIKSDNYIVTKPIRERHSISKFFDEHKISYTTDFVNLIDRMLDTNPKTRITAKEALQHPFLI